MPERRDPHPPHRSNDRRPQPPHEPGIADPLVEVDFTPVRLFVRFDASKPTLQEILAVRSLDDRLRNMPMSDVQRLLADKSEFELGVWPAPSAMLVAERAAELDLATFERAVEA